MRGIIWAAVQRFLSCTLHSFVFASTQMKRSLSKFAALLSIGGILAASAESLEAENLLISPPGDFVVGHQSAQGQRSLTEFVPKGQTVQEWTEMLTVQVFRGASFATAGFLQDVGGRYVAACPGTTSRGIMTGKTNGYEVSMLVLNCPTNTRTGKPETTAFRVIKGNDAVYAVQRAWRSIVTDGEMANFMRDLGKVTVCDTRSAEHACPQLNPIAQ